tara:strand:- start:819 stop:932 length:114 start_codon:yes stop_codon:yes gene_type:complete
MKVRNITSNNGNKNDDCCTYQLKDMIEKTFKMWGYYE